MIFTVHEEILTMIESPIPYLIGVSKGLSEFEEEKLYDLKQAPDYIIVDLDNNLFKLEP